MKSHLSASSTGANSHNKKPDIAQILDKNKLADPALKRSFKGHKDAVNSCVFNPNLKQVVSGS